MICDDRLQKNHRAIHMFCSIFHSNVCHTNLDRISSECIFFFLQKCAFGCFAYVQYIFDQDLVFILYE